MDVRKANIDDFDAIYQIGLNTPEFKVSETEVFMDEDDLKSRITAKKSVFLLAEEQGKIVGFIHASSKDADSPLKNRYACLVYLVVLPAFRGKGIAGELYERCVQELKLRGITHFYSWANAESDGSMINFLKNKGFAEGHKYVWMDRKL